MMEYLLNFSSFIKEKLSYNKLEDKLEISKDKLLKSIDAHKIKWDFPVRYDINSLAKDKEFNDALDKKEVSRGKIYYSGSFNNFLPHPMKWMFLDPKGSTNLEKPVYLILQEKEENQWKVPELYLVNKETTYFYQEITTATIRLIWGSKYYTYQTTNAGNNWILQNIEKENGVFKRNLRDEEMKELMKKTNIEWEIKR